MPAKFCIQNVYKSLLKCGIHFVYKHFVYILYAKVCRNVGYVLYTNILSTLRLSKCEIDFVCIHFLHVLYTKCMQKVVEMWDTFVIQTFCIHFVHILYTKYIQKIVEMWDRFCICTNILYTLYIHEFWSTKSVHY